MADVLNTLVRQEKLKQNLQKCGNVDHERGRLWHSCSLGKCDGYFVYLQD